MSEKLPRPEIDRFPDLEPGDVRVLEAGTDIARIYSAGGRHPTTWNTFRAHGPTGCRFDHQTVPPREHPTRRVIYAAPAVAGPDGNMYPSMKSCLAECFRDSGTVDLNYNEPYFVVFVTQRDLRLLDMGESDWVTRAGGNGAISSGSRSRSREWARAIYRRYAQADGIDGLFYPSSNIPVARSVALWESAESSLPAHPDLNEPLRHAGLRAAVEKYAAELHLDLLT